MEKDNALIVDDPLEDVFPGTYDAPMPKAYYPRSQTGVWLSASSEDVAKWEKERRIE